MHSKSKWGLVVDKIRFKIFILGSIFVSLLLSVQGQAQQSEEDKRRTTIDFEDELVQGDVNKPELFYLLQKKQFNFKRLIKLRENFLPEMRRTSEDIQQGGSGD